MAVLGRKKDGYGKSSRLRKGGSHRLTRLGQVASRGRQEGGLEVEVLAGEHHDPRRVQEMGPGGGGPETRTLVWKHLWNPQGRGRSTEGAGG